MAQCSKKTRLSVAVKRPEIRSHQNFPIPWEIPHLSSNSKMSREKKPCAKTCVGTGIEVLRAEPKKCSKIEYIYDNFICIYTHHTVNSTWKGFTSHTVPPKKKATPERFLSSPTPILPTNHPQKKNIISGGLPTSCYFHHSRCPLWGTPRWKAPQVERNGNLRTCHDHRPENKPVFKGKGGPRNPTEKSSAFLRDYLEVQDTS